MWVRVTLWIVALKPAQQKVEGKKLDAKPVDVKPVDVKPVDVKPVDAKPVDVTPADVKPAPGEVAGGGAAVVGDAPLVEGEQKKKPDWNSFSSVAMSKIPVSTPMRGSVLSARIDVLKKPKAAPVVDENDDD